MGWSTGSEALSTVEAPVYCDTRDGGFSGCIDVSHLVTDVEHGGWCDAKRSSDRAKVAALAFERCGGGDEGEKISYTVSFQEKFDVFG